MESLNRVSVPDPVKPSRAELALGPLVIFDVCPPNLTAIVVKPTREGWQLVDGIAIRIEWHPEDGLAPENLPEVLSELENLDPAPKRAALIVPNDLAIHELVSVPKMGAKDRDRVFDRKIGEHMDSNDNYAFESLLMGKGAGGGGRASKEAYLVTGAPRKALFRLHERISKAGLKPTWITPAPAALYALLAAIQPTEPVPWGLLDLDETAATLTIQKGANIVLLRTIRFRGTIAQQGVTEDVAGEMHRSLLFYQQRFPGQNVARIVVSSHHQEEASAVASALNESLDQEVFILDPFEFVPSPTDGNAGTYSGVPNLSRTIGLLHAMKGPGKGYNLNPPEIRTRKLQIRATVAVAMFLCLVGGFGHFFTAETPALTEDSRRLQRETVRRLTKLEDVSDAHQQMIARKESLQVFLEAYERLSSNRVDWLSFFNQISSLPREMLRCNRITLYSDLDKNARNNDPQVRWYAGIGCVADGSFVETQSLMREAAAVLRSQPLMDRVNVKPPNSRAESGIDLESPMTPFEIECRLHPIDTSSSAP